MKKRHTRQNSQKKEGGWFTKHKLEHSECWTKSFGRMMVLLNIRLRGMIAKALQWAKDNNRHRINPVHGEEELYITIHDGFEMKVIESEEMTKSGCMDVKDCSPLSGIWVQIYVG